MADRFPLIVDTTDNNKIKEIPNGDNLTLTGNSLTGVIDVTASGIITSNNLNVSGTFTYQSNPLASIATSGAYSDISGRPLALSDLTDDLNVLVPGDSISLLNNNAGYLSVVDFQTDVNNTPTTLSGYGITDAATAAQGALAQSAVQPGDGLSTLLNDPGFVTLDQLTSGAITVDVNNSGDLVGSVFAQDSTVMIDGITGSINLDGTIRSNVVPHADDLHSLGTSTEKFTTAHLSSTLNLSPLTAAPGSPVDGMIAIADGTGWDPLSNAVLSMVVYLDGAWRQIAVATV